MQNSGQPRLALRTPARSSRWSWIRHPAGRLLAAAAVAATTVLGFFVAEQFTGFKGKYVQIAETVKGFKEIVDGKHDDLPEQAFYMVGTIEEAVEKARKMAAEAA